MTLDNRVIEVGAKRINEARLTEDLKAALGADVISGVSTTKGRVFVVFTKPPTDEQFTQARDVFAAHDPEQVTMDQARRLKADTVHADLKAQVEAFDLEKPLSPAEAETAVRFLLARLRALKE